MNLEDCNSFDGYALIVIDDTPYHAGVEYWFSDDLSTLIEEAMSEWDWMELSEASLARFKYNHSIETIEDILPDEDNERFGFGKVDNELYPIIKTKDNYVNIYICLSCDIFKRNPGVCDKCKTKLQDANKGKISLE